MMAVAVVVVMREVDVRDSIPAMEDFCWCGNVKVIAVELELFQLALKAARVHAIGPAARGNEHVAGDATDEVEVEGFHSILFGGQ